MLKSPSGPPNIVASITVPANIINAGARSLLTVAAPGVLAGDRLAWSFVVTLDAGLVVQYVSARANLIELSIFNPTAGNITPAAPRVCVFEVLQDN